MKVGSCNLSSNTKISCITTNMHYWFETCGPVKMGILAARGTCQGTVKYGIKAIMDHSEGLVCARVQPYGHLCISQKAKGREYHEYKKEKCTDAYYMHACIYTCTHTYIFTYVHIHIRDTHTQ
jgi:hypothetical protein